MPCHKLCHHTFFRQIYNMAWGTKLWSALALPDHPFPYHAACGPCPGRGRAPTYTPLLDLCCSDFLICAVVEPALWTGSVLRSQRLLSCGREKALVAWITTSAEYRCAAASACLLCAG